MRKMLRVRNVPEPVHRALPKRAARRGKSLSAYLLDELARLAQHEPIEEWLDDVHRHPPVRLRSTAARLIRRERDTR